jgi:hypothetical protein
MNEKRALQRFSLELPVRMISTANGREKITLSTSNICSTGAFIRSDAPYPVGTDLEMEIFLLSDQPGKDDIIYTRGRVVRTEAAGMAVSFEENYNIEPCESSCGQ